MDQRYADGENDVTYITLFLEHFEGPCNRNLRKILLNSVIVRPNTLHIGIYMIELFYKAAITSIKRYIITLLAVLGWPFTDVICTNGQNLNIA